MDCMVSLSPGGLGATCHLQDSDRILIIFGTCHLYRGMCVLAAIKEVGWCRDHLWHWHLMTFLLSLLDTYFPAWDGGMVVPFLWCLIWLQGGSWQGLCSFLTWERWSEDTEPEQPERSVGGKGKAQAVAPRERGQALWTGSSSGAG